MTNDKGILIKNIYYMLTYAFQTLRRSDFDTVAAEKFENIHDLFAAILGKGVAYQLKQGLYKEYILSLIHIYADNGIKRKTVGVGIGNIAYRIKGMYNNSGIKIYSVKERGTVIQIFFDNYSK